MKSIDITKFILCMKRMGYSVIGSGLFSQVWHKEGSNKVIKIYTDDPAYDIFLSRIVENNNPFFPKIYRIKKYSCDGKIIKIVLIEKLKVYNTLSLARRYRFTVKYTKFVEADSGDAVTNYSFNALVNFYKPVNEKNKFLSDAVKVLSEILDDYGYNLDLHDANVMLRGKQVVFVDPIYDPDNAYCCC